MTEDQKLNLFSSMHSTDHRQPVKKKNPLKKKLKKLVKPDEYFSLGPLEVARFGKFIATQNRMDSEQFEKFRENLAARYDEICAEIDTIISQLVDLISKIDPVELLKRSYWEFVASNAGIIEEVKLSTDQVLSLRMIDYVQSIVVSTKPNLLQFIKIQEKDWLALKRLIRRLFEMINFDYMICGTAHRRKSDPNFTIEYEEYYVKAQMYWCNIRGHRYLIHDLEFFKDFFSPHNNVFIKLFNVTSAEFINSITLIARSLTEGVSRTGEDYHSLNQQYKSLINIHMNKNVGTDSIDFETIFEKLLSNNKFMANCENVLGRLYGADLFDVEKVSNLHKPILENLAYSPGQETDFFGAGQYRGWPLRVWPTFKRPFLKLDKYYCFDLHGLVDNLYRVMQRTICKLLPSYRETWNEKQKTISEQLPFQFFGKILPGATIQKSVYYKWQTGRSGKQWCETDGLIIYDDQLFIIEVKAGAFTHSPPATDFESYIESIRNLIFIPAKQGNRFIEYLNSAPEVELYDSNHNLLSTIKSSSFRKTTICAISLDQLTELAAQAQHLKHIGVDLSEYPVWAISLDDLRIFADIFENPLIFLHYVEERMRAFNQGFIAEDELDHLGLYFKHNVYTEYAKDFGGTDRLSWAGYRSAFDRYFHGLLYDETPPALPGQKLPHRIKEIIDFLASSQRPNRRRMASILLNLDGDWRKRISDHIDYLLARQLEVGRAIPFCTYGTINLNIYCWQNNIVKKDKQELIAHVLETMIIADEKGRTLLELSYDNEMKLVDIDFKFVDVGDFSPAEIEERRQTAEVLRTRRIALAKKTTSKIGRNEPCPCGSGKKYKKCCLLRGY